jgi:hypothetical protein
MVLFFVILGILGPLMLVGGIYLFRLKQPHAFYVLAMGLGLTVFTVISVASMLLGP